MINNKNLLDNDKNNKLRIKRTVRGRLSMIICSLLSSGNNRRHW